MNLFGIFRTPVHVEQAHWSPEEKDKLDNAIRKSKEIQSRIDPIMSNILRSPMFSQKYPRLTNRAQQYANPIQRNSLQQPKAITEEYLWIKTTMMPLFSTNNERIPISQDLIKNLKTACAIITRETEHQSEINFDEYMIAQNFTKACLEYVRNHKEQCSNQDIINIICTPEKNREGATRQPTVEDLEKTLENHIQFVDKAYLRHYIAELKPYDNLLSTVEKIIMCCMDDPECIMFAELVAGVPVSQHFNGDASSPQMRETEGNIAKAADLRERYIAAPDDTRRFAIACEIINKAEGDDSLMPTSIHLDALRVMSLHSKEVPTFYKTLALKLCNELNKNLDVSQKHSSNQVPKECVLI